MTAAHEGVLRERHSLEVQLGLSVTMSVGSDLQTVSIYPHGIGPLDFQGVDKALGVPGHACCSICCCSAILLLLAFRLEHPPWCRRCMRATHEGVLRERHSLEVQLGMWVKTSVGSDWQTVLIYLHGTGPLDFQGVNKVLEFQGVLAVLSVVVRLVILLLAYGLIIILGVAATWLRRMKVCFVNDARSRCNSVCRWKCQLVPMGKPHWALGFPGRLRPLEFQGMLAVLSVVVQLFYFSWPSGLSILLGVAGACVQRMKVSFANDTLWRCNSVCWWKLQLVPTGKPY